eukprot:7282150-Prymnesium_polylepis.1
MVRARPRVGSSKLSDNRNTPAAWRVVGSIGRTASSGTVRSAALRCCPIIRRKQVLCRSMTSSWRRWSRGLVLRNLRSSRRSP